ncbi:MAG: cache domain-containing protein [Methanosarcina sp.]|jgi:mannose-6-phosphate isomerase-like protein (cupin superfamily)|nr:cache domain-containing protein [Methanosarcina sp.]MDD3316719.1 cache domain-containing protein [Methanosarcina sp.]MDD4305395.1 cache domain-containing protein [Methanosarcina sp.]MDD4620591.1 cache domain-containing protein [Methanosarcina sp.]
MDLIKTACIMLVVAFFLGILTSGDNKEISTNPAELENEAISSDINRVTGTVQIEEKSEIYEPAVPKPAPDPLIFEKGESKLAGERKNIENKVRATVRLIETQGEGLFPSFRDKGSPWFQDSFCIFVWTADGTQVVCPSDPSHEGKAMKGLVDADGKPIGKLFIETALSEKGEGWIEYNWQERNNSKPFYKCTFIKKASYGEETYIVGADLYVENYIVCRSVNECEYTDEPEKLQIAELLNPLSLDRNLNLSCSIAHSIVEPGKSVVPHLEKNPEIHYILEGKGLLYIDGIPVNIHSDQLIFIPAEAIQTTYNTENTTLKFLIISQPTSSEHSTVILN